MSDIYCLFVVFFYIYIYASAINLIVNIFIVHVASMSVLGAQWLSGRVLDSRPKGSWFEPHQRHCVVSLSKNINPSLVLVQPRKTCPFITERLLMGRKESNQTNNICIPIMALHNPSYCDGSLSIFHP